MTGPRRARHGIWLVRHAPTAWTGRRWCGRADPPLSKHGRRLATLLAATLARELPQATIVRSSPALRALWTAEPIAALTGLPLEIDPDLVEVDVGRVEGWTWEEVTGREPATAAAILTGHVDWPDGERASDVEDRAASVAERVARTARTRPIVVVSHGRFLSDLARILGTTTGTAGLEPCGVIRIP